MNTIRCTSCGFLNFASDPSCKRCKAEFVVAESAAYNQFALAPEGAYQTMPAWPRPEYRSQYGPAAYFPGGVAPLPRASKHGATNAVLWVLLAITLVIAFAIGIVWRFNKPASDRYTWEHYQPADKSYSALMPIKPTESIERRQSPAGELQMHLSMSYLGSQGVCLVGYADYPDNFRYLSADGVLEAGANGAVMNSGATLVSKKKITLDGHPGIELETEFSDKQLAGGGRATSRIYWVAPRIYITLAGGPNSAITDSTIKKFLDSFKLLKKG